MARATSGGGEKSRVVSHYQDGKREPVNYPVSMNRPSEIGLAHYYSPEPLKNYSTPVGPTNNLDCRVGGNGRQVLPSGSQAKTRAPRSMGSGRSLFEGPKGRR
jgi:hypothetical protein